MATEIVILQLNSYRWIVKLNIATLGLEFLGPLIYVIVPVDPLLSLPSISLSYASITLAPTHTIRDWQASCFIDRHVFIYYYPG